MTKIPILMYHDLQPETFDLSRVEVERTPYILRESDFDRQVKWLRDNGYRTIALSDFVDSPSNKISLSKKMAVIVFDDGFVSNYSYACPVLQECGFTAAFFVIVGSINSPGFMTWEQIKKMADCGMEIGSHTMTHPFPTELGDEELEFELRKSKEILEEKLGKRIDFLSSPTGFYNRTMPKIAKKVGYKGVLVSRIEFNDYRLDPFFLKKIGIKRNMNFSTFQSIIRGERKTLLSLRINQMIRDWGKKILGSTLYDRARRIVLNKSFKLI